MPRGRPRMAAGLGLGTRRAFWEHVGRHAAHLSGAICGACAVNTATPILRSHKLDDDDRCRDGGDRRAGSRGDLAVRPRVETDPPAAIESRGQLAARLVAGRRVKGMVDGRRVLAPEGVCAGGEAEVGGREVDLLELRLGRGWGAEGDEVLARAEPVAGQAHNLGLFGPLLSVLGLRTFPQPRSGPFQLFPLSRPVPALLYDAISFSCTQLATN